MVVGRNSPQFSGLGRDERRTELEAAKRFGAVSESVATVAAGLADAVADIATNTSDIADNTAAIAANTSDIADNTAAIADNADAIADLPVVPIIQHGVSTVTVSSGSASLSFPDPFPVTTSPTVVVSPSSGNEVTVAINSVTRFGFSIYYYQGGTLVTGPTNRSIHWTAMVTQ